MTDCPVCAATGTAACATKYGRDHRARIRAMLAGDDLSVPAPTRALDGLPRDVEAALANIRRDLAKTDGPCPDVRMGRGRWDALVSFLGRIEEKHRG